MATKKQEKKDNTELVRIEKITVQRVRKHTSLTKQSIGGFFMLAAEEKLQKETENNSQLNNNQCQSQ